MEHNTRYSDDGLAKGSNGADILVDSGFYRDKFFKQLKPEDISDVIITHMHWDHAGWMDLFPKARIWIQQDEYAYYTGDAWQPSGSHGGIDVEDVFALVKANTKAACA